MEGARRAPLRLAPKEGQTPSRGPDLGSPLLRLVSSKPKS